MLSGQLTYCCQHVQYGFVWYQQHKRPADMHACIHAMSEAGSVGRLASCVQ
jgi:hypothetical protein